MNNFLQTAIFTISEFTFTIESLLTLLSVLILARVVIYASGIILERYFDKKHLDRGAIGSILRFLRYTVYFLAVYYALKLIAFDYHGVTETVLFKIGDNTITFGDVFVVVVVLLIARLMSLILNPVVVGYLKGKKVDPGRMFAIVTFLRYLLYLLAVLIAFNLIDFRLTSIIGGLVGLLVGIGLGLQHTFTDWFSGIILLVEASVEVGDIIQLENEVVRVKVIGIRSSKVETRDGVVIIVPNTQLVGNKVINWSNNHRPTRFQVNVGVSYSSDIKLVTEILLNVAKQHISVLKEPPPIVFFNDFGSSSLDFILYFYSNDFFYIEKVKSEIRYQIAEKFRENNVVIPFPQRDVWMRSE